MAISRSLGVGTVGTLEGLSRVDWGYERSTKDSIGVMWRDFRISGCTVAECLSLGSPWFDAWIWYHYLLCRTIAKDLGGMSFIMNGTEVETFRSPSRDQILVKVANPSSNSSAPPQQLCLHAGYRSHAHSSNKLNSAVACAGFSQR